MWKDISFLKQGDKISNEDLLQFQVSLNRKLSHALSYIRNDQIINIEAKKITTNEAKITTAQIENLVVGGNVIMGPNATITWGNVTSRPGYLESTKITSTTIESPNILGGLVAGSTVRSSLSSTGERIELSGNTFKVYNSSDNLNGFVFGDGVGSFGDVSFYWNGAKIAEMYFSGIGFSIEQSIGYRLDLGSLGKETVCLGNWDFGFANVSNLDVSNTSVSHNHGITPGLYIAVYDSDGVVQGYQKWFQFVGSHTHTIS